MRGWTCENRCTIGEGHNKKEIPYYWSAAGREIDVSKSICDNGNTVVLRCSVGSEKMTLIKDDTIIEILKYNACVTNKRRVKRFVNCIERRFNE